MVELWRQVHGLNSSSLFFPTGKSSPSRILLGPNTHWNRHQARMPTLATNLFGSYWNPHYSNPAEPKYKGSGMWSSNSQMQVVCDSLLFLASPSTSLPNLCQTLEEFSVISGLQVNFCKSLAMNVSLPSDTVSLLQHSFKFAWNETFIKYLGINLTPPMFRKLDTDLQTWSKHNFSWTGRVNLIKMTLLPKLLYLFRSLPIPIKRAYIKSFQSKILKNSFGVREVTEFRKAQCTVLGKRGGLGLST